MITRFNIDRSKFPTDFSDYNFNSIQDIFHIHIDTIGCWVSDNANNTGIIINNVINDFPFVANFAYIFDFAYIFGTDQTPHNNLAYAIEKYIFNIFSNAILFEHMQIIHTKIDSLNICYDESIRPYLKFD